MASEFPTDIRMSFMKMKISHDTIEEQRKKLVVWMTEIFEKWEKGSLPFYVVEDLLDFISKPITIHNSMTQLVDLDDLDDHYACDDQHSDSSLDDNHVEVSPPTRSLSPLKPTVFHKGLAKLWIRLSKLHYSKDSKNELTRVICVSRTEKAISSPQESITTAFIKGAR